MKEKDLSGVVCHYDPVTIIIPARSPSVNSGIENTQKNHGSTDENTETSDCKHANTKDLETKDSCYPLSLWDLVYAICSMHTGNSVTNKNRKTILPRTRQSTSFMVDWWPGPLKLKSYRAIMCICTCFSMNNKIIQTVSCPDKVIHR